MNKDLEIIPTADGSYTLYNKEMDETYHSKNGAWSESQYVYIEMGIQDLPFNEVRVLEIGFGTGTNAILTYLYSQKFHFKVKYTTLEPFPLEWELVEKMQFDNKLSTIDWAVFKEMHKIEFNNVNQMGPYFTFDKIKETIELFDTKEIFDIIYLDAFAPSKQADIWDIANIKKMHDLLMPNGKLVSYCAQGQFKRNLKEVGFRVENPSGPHHKKEMTVAFKL
jgi:tRNA U34 5-methylaminomethyl-2-thiouridine-forming methyltransferase MnmC